MDDITGGNPNLWLPRGTVWLASDFNQADTAGTGTKYLYTDIKNVYCPSGDFTAQ